MFQMTTPLSSPSSSQKPKIFTKQIGKNGHDEYGWSEYTKEKIVQLNYQLVRTYKSAEIAHLADILYNIIKDLQDGLENGKLLPEEFQEQIVMLYKLVAYTRDIIDGKGEYMLAYMQILVWYGFYPRLAEFLLKTCVIMPTTSKQHPYGSWKDMKYFCNYCKQETGDKNHPLIQYAIELTNQQLAKDTENDKITLVAKWIPREKQPAFSWLFKKMAHAYFKEYLTTCINDDASQEKRAKNKCEMDYRKLISHLNRRLDTTQIKQCENKWSQIEPSNITSQTLFKQRKAFLNIPHKKSVGASEKKTMRKTTKDRLYCRNNIMKYIESGIKKTSHIQLNEYVKSAIQIIEQNNPERQDECNLLNTLWKQNGDQINLTLRPMVAMVDTSLSMLKNDALYFALGLGIQVAEKNAYFGKQIMTFGKTSRWHNLEHCEDFISAVKAITGNNHKDISKNPMYLDEYSNLYDGIDKLLDTIVESKMPEKQVAEMGIIIFSNMNFIKPQNQDQDQDFITVYEAIKRKYENAGQKVNNKPYTLPHIVFWNMESTHGFPCLSVHPNVTMISGNNPKLLNLFQDKAGITYCSETTYNPNITPFTKMKECLKNTRYKCLEEKIVKMLFYPDKY
uniref:DUF7788 domain-containing protein n=1 Tax=viral metagenome TaxID=1070528 RepID=A0A6C0BUV8_9ZZZZ